MFFLMQKILEFSMRLGMRRNRFVRVWYAERMERRLMDGTWNPAEKWKKKKRKRRRRKNRR